MKVMSINLQEGMPSSVVVELTIEEATWIAQKVGKETGGDRVVQELWFGFTQNVFNPFYDDGVPGL